jgi:3-phosphoshikimate 1-carboxyvinyltransferase
MKEGIIEIRPAKGRYLKGTIELPPDKSIAHRALLFPCLYLEEGVKVNIPELLNSSDIKATIGSLSKLGVNIEVNFSSDKPFLCSANFTTLGKGNFKEPEEIIDAGNSGTTARLILGILATCNFFSVVTGDESLRQRPMLRVTKHLIKMGAQISGRRDGNLLPLAIVGNSELKGGYFELEVASAQVKSAILLAAAGVKESEEVRIKEPYRSRDHSERFLKYLGINLKREDSEIVIKGGQTSPLKEITISIPKDISQAAFFMVAAATLPHSSLLLKNLGLNPTRSGIIDVLKSMGAKIEIDLKEKEFEPRGDIKIEYSPNLVATEIQGDLIPRLIDEIPAIAVLATQAEGETIIRDAEELRYKETDRLRGIKEGLSLIGAEVEELKDGLIIKGKRELSGNATLNTYNDHRLLMAFTIAGLLAKAPIYLTNSRCEEISFPGFFSLLESTLTKE